jgi:hypothetical protein
LAFRYAQLLRHLCLCVIGVGDDFNNARRGIYGQPTLGLPVSFQDIPKRMATPTLFVAELTQRRAADFSRTPAQEDTEAMRRPNIPRRPPRRSLPVPPLSPFGGAPTFSRKQVRKALHGFVLGSAAGMSGLSPKHLRSTSFWCSEYDEAG